MGKPLSRRWSLCSSSPFSIASEVFELRFPHDSAASLDLACTRRLASRASLSSAVSVARRSLARSLSRKRR